MSNAPGPGGQGRSRRRPTPTSGPRRRPDAPKRRTPAAAAGSRSPRAQAGERARWARTVGRVPARRALTCTCRGRPSRPTRGRRARGHRGGRCSAPRASPSRGCTHLTNPPRPRPALRGARRIAHNARRRSHRRRRTAGRRGYTQPRRVHYRGAAAEGARDCACAGSGAGSRELSRPGEGRRGWGRGGRGAGGADALPRPLATAGAFAGARRGPQVPQRAVSLGTGRAGAKPCCPGLDRRSRVHFECVGLSRSRKMNLRCELRTARTNLTHGVHMYLTTCVSVCGCGCARACLLSLGGWMGRGGVW